MGSRKMDINELEETKYTAANESRTADAAALRKYIREKIREHITKVRKWFIAQDFL